ncbi:MAG: nuclear transport factor 2 family protein [Nevskiales bacterium]
MTYSSTDLIAAVKQSPALVAVHDRARWCGLYAADGQVNDPVGSRPHQGRAAIERFYDTFIAPNTIVFHVEQDIVCGMSVMRDLNIQTTMSTGVTLSVPMHLRYDLAEEGGVLKIRRLYAHWELPFMISQLLKTGLKGIWTSIKLGPQLIANQGFGGMLGFMRGFLGNGRAGKRTAEAFLGAISRGDAATAGNCLANSCYLEMPAHNQASLEELATRLRGLQWRKVLAAGNCVTVSMQGQGLRGIALFHFDQGPRQISGLQIFI